MHVRQQPLFSLSVDIRHPVRIAGPGRQEDRVGAPVKRGPSEWQCRVLREALGFEPVQRGCIDTHKHVCTHLHC